jgi:hypothetical protein
MELDVDNNNESQRQQDIETSIREFETSIERRHELIQQTFPLRAAPIIVPQLQQQQQQQQQLPSPPLQQQQQRSTPIITTPHVHVPANDTTIIIPADRSDIVKMVLTACVDKGVYGMLQMPKIIARIYTPMSTALTWGDIRLNDTKRCALTMGQLLKCGVGLVDLRYGHLAASYKDLKEVFSFNPADLTISYSLLNLGHLNQFFQVNYQHLIIDFSVGIEDYLLQLQTTLIDIAAAGISIETALNWTDHVKQAFTDFNKTDPTARGSMDKRLSTLLRPLDTTMFMRRVKRCKDSPEDWHIFIGMGGEHLIKMGITRGQLMELWGNDYGTIDVIFDVFDCSTEERQKIPNNVPILLDSTRDTSVSSSSKKTKKKD